MKRLIILILAVCFMLVACKGPITGHNYTKEEVVKILKFLGVSAQRIEKFKNGEITPEDLKISKQRMKEAKDYIEKLEREAKSKRKAK